MQALDRPVTLTQNRCPSCTEWAVTGASPLVELCLDESKGQEMGGTGCAKSWQQQRPHRPGLCWLEPRAPRDDAQRGCAAKRIPASEGPVLLCMLTVGVWIACDWDMGRDGGSLGQKRGSGVRTRIPLLVLSPKSSSSTFCFYSMINVICMVGRLCNKSPN